MKAAYFKPTICIEFGEESMHVLNARDPAHGIDIPLERDATGRLTATSCDSARNALRGFLHGFGGTSGPQAVCAIPARGVSFRILSLPSSARENIGRLLMLQMEAQLPLSPSELEWGYIEIRGSKNPTGAELRNFLVAAVKKEFVEDYIGIISTAGFTPHLTIAALARCSLSTETGRGFAFLEAGRKKSELALVDEQGGVTIRVLPSAEGKPEFSTTLLRTLGNSVDRKLYVSGTEAASLDGELRRLQPALASEVVDSSGPGRSAANLGVLHLIETGSTPMLLGEESAAEKQSRSQAGWKWAAAAGLLLIASLLLRYAEGTLYRGKISRKLAEVTRYKATLPRVDRELSFLNFIKTNQPPYLEAIAVVANAAPPGTRLDGLNLVRHGELSVRGSSMGNPKAPGEFRAKLIDSGFFSHVVIEEQTPVDNGQKINFRLSALVKPDGVRKPYVAEAPSASPNKIPDHPSTRPSGKPPVKSSVPPAQLTQK